MSINISQIEEIWKPIPGFEGMYEVSNFGKIKRLKGFKCKKDRLKSFSISNAGYYRVDLKTREIHKKYSVHRLVAESFLEKSFIKKDVNHKDGNKLNNHYLNLEYISKSDNQKHAYQKGLQKIQRGSARKNVAKLNENQILEIRKIYIEEKITIKQIAKNFNVSSSNISLILKKKRWAHI